MARKRNRGIGSPETLIGAIASILASIIGVKLTLEHVLKIEGISYIDSAQVVILGTLIIGGIVFYVSDYIATNYLKRRL